MAPASGWRLISAGPAASIRCKPTSASTRRRSAAATAPPGASTASKRPPDGARWQPIVDRSAATRDLPHDYVELAAPAQARWVRVVNVHTPGGGTFAVRDLRVFGGAEAARRRRWRGSRSTATRATRATRSCAGISCPAPRAISSATAPRPASCTAPARCADSERSCCTTSTPESPDFFTIDAFNDSGRHGGNERRRRSDRSERGRGRGPGPGRGRGRRPGRCRSRGPVVRVG